MRRRSTTKRLVAGLLLACALAVAACGPLPRPFARDDGADPLVREPLREGIAVAVVDGTTLPMGQLLSMSVAGKLQQRDLPASVGALDRARYALRGTARINDGSEAHAYPVTVHWRLEEGEAGTVHEFVQGIEAARWEWDYGSPAVISAVAEDAADRVARAILGEAADRPLEQFVKPPRVGVWVTPVDGAGPAGNQALRRAMMAALGEAGLALADDAERARYAVAGAFRLEPPVDGTRKVEVVWRILDADGAELGKATQRNRVPAATFDGPWGPAAALIARAAVDGVRGVITETEQRLIDPSADPSRRLRRPPPTGEIPLPPGVEGPPPTPDLPRTPGRAPPPG